MELLLCWNVCDQVLAEIKDIIYKCYRYRADSDTVRFPAGRQCVIMSMGQTRRLKTWNLLGLYVRMESNRSK